MTGNTCPMRVGTVYTVSGFAEGTPFMRDMYCARTGSGVVDLVGRDGEAVLLIRGHPVGEIAPAREGFSLGDNVACSTHPRGSSEYGVYAPYTKRLTRSK